MTNTVFFSWQSDLGETRGVIQAALDKAVRNLNRDLALEEALRLDEDTSGVAGWPEITSTILDKIERCEGLIRFVPDHVEVLSDGSEVVERLRTGRPTKSEVEKDIYALYVTAAQTAEPRVRRSVQVRYLSADQVAPINLRPGPIKTRLNHYNEAIRGILRQDFSPKPNDRTCPRCPHYFICPLGEDA